MDLAERIKDLLDAHEVGVQPGGHLSRVFVVAARDGERSVAKVVNAALVDVREVVARSEAVAELSRLDPRVCRPLPHAGRS